MPGSARVIFEEGFSSLPGPLDDAEAEVVKVLQDEQKIQQALAVPTILLVDVALTGMSVFRPMNVWAQRLNVLLPTDTPFVGIAVMMPELISPDAPPFFPFPSMTEWAVWRLASACQILARCQTP